MSVYSFKIPKGKFQLSLTTTDQELVRDQFALWVRKSAEYVQKHKAEFNNVLLRLEEEKKNNEVLKNVNAEHIIRSIFKIKSCGRVREWCYPCSQLSFDSSNPRAITLCIYSRINSSFRHVC